MPKGKRSEEVLEVAFKMFSSAAIESVRMTDIADKACIGVATIYRYFGTKQHLVAQVGAREWSRQIALIESHFANQEMEARPGLDQIEFLLTELVENYEDFQDLLRFSANIDQYFLHEQASEKESALYREALMPLFDLLFGAFDKAVGEGELQGRFSDRTYQTGGVLSLIGSAQKYASRGLLCGDDDEVHMQWLRTQVKTYIYCLRNQSVF